MVTKELLENFLCASESEVASTEAWPAGEVVGPPAVTPRPTFSQTLVSVFIINFLLFQTQKN